MDKGRDAGIAAGGAPRQADDARVKPGAASSHVRATLLPSSPLLALLLAACGGGGGGGAPPPVTTSPRPVSPPGPKTRTDAPAESQAGLETGADPKSEPSPRPEETLSSISGAVHDGPVQNASVYVDVNQNHQYDAGDVSVDPQTDRFGNYEGEIAEQYRGLPLVAFNRFATHVGSGEPLPDHLATPAGARVISPLTHIIALWPSMTDPLRQTIKSHPLFRNYDPLQDNIFTPTVNPPHKALIKLFLVDLTKLIIKFPSRPDLKDAASILLRDYADRLVEPPVLARDPPTDVDIHDDAPTGFRFQNPVASLAETSDTSNAIRLAALRVDDPDTNPAFRDHSFTLSGVDRALFEVRDGALYLKAGAKLDADTDAELEVKVTLNGTSFEQTFRLAVTDIHDEAPVFGAAGYVARIDENSAAGTALATVRATPEVVDGAAEQPGLTYSLAAAGGGDLPQWLAALVAIDPQTGKVTLAARPAFEALKLLPGVRVNTTTGELDIAFRVVATATHDGTTLTSHSAVTLTVLDVDEPAYLTRVNGADLSVSTKAAPGRPIRIAENTRDIGSFRVSDPDGDMPTVDLEKDTKPNLQLHQEGDLFTLRFKAGRLPDFERPFKKSGAYRSYDPDKLATSDENRYSVSIILNEGRPDQTRIRHVIQIIDGAEAPAFATDGPPAQTNARDRPQLHPNMTADHGNQPSMMGDVVMAEGVRNVGWFRIIDDHPEAVDIRLAGEDGDLFRISDADGTGAYRLRFKSPPDFEAPRHGGTQRNSTEQPDNVYEVTIVLADRSTQPSASPTQTKLPLRIVVTNVEGPLVFAPVRDVPPPTPSSRGEVAHASLAFSVAHPDPQADPSLAASPGAAPRTPHYLVDVEGAAPSRADSWTPTVDGAGSAAISAWGRYGKWYLVKTSAGMPATPASFALHYQTPYGGTATSLAAGERMVDSITVLTRTSDAAAGDRLVRKTIYAIITGREPQADDRQADDRQADDTLPFSVELTDRRPDGHLPPAAQLVLVGDLPDIDGDGIAEDRYQAFIKEMAVISSGIRLGEIMIRNADGTLRDLSATPTLAGNELGWFEIRAGSGENKWELWLKGDVELDFQTLPVASEITRLGEVWRNLAVAFESNDPAAPGRYMLGIGDSELYARHHVGYTHRAVYIVFDENPATSQKLALRHSPFNQALPDSDEIRSLVRNDSPHVDRPVILSFNGEMITHPHTFETQHAFGRGWLKLEFAGAAGQFVKFTRLEAYSANIFRLHFETPDDFMGYARLSANQKGLEVVELQLLEDGGEVVSRRLAFYVNGRNDLPSATDHTVSVAAVPGQGLTLTPAMFPAPDVDLDPDSQNSFADGTQRWTHIRFADSAGLANLRFKGAPVTAGQEIAFTDIENGALTFMLPADIEARLNAAGGSPVPIALDWQVLDAGSEYAGSAPKSNFWSHRATLTIEARKQSGPPPDPGRALDGDRQEGTAAWDIFTADGTADALAATQKFHGFRGSGHDLIDVSKVPGGRGAQLQFTRRDVDGDGSVDTIVHKRDTSPDTEALFVLMDYDAPLNADDFYGAGPEIT